MVTTRRSNESSYEQNNLNTSVALLERPVENTSVAPEKQVSADQVERMRKNLDDLLNYDRYSAVVEEEKQQVLTEETNSLDEDFRPTSTTMQFGDDNVDIRNEMNQIAVEETTTRYRLNGKGKIAVVLYSIAVMVVLALIVLNTGVIANLRDVKAAKVARLEELKATYNQQIEDIEAISNPEYIGSIVEAEGWVKQ